VKAIEEDLKVANNDAEINKRRTGMIKRQESTLKMKNKAKRIISSRQCGSLASLWAPPKFAARGNEDGSRSKSTPGRSRGLTAAGTRQEEQDDEFFETRQVAACSLEGASDAIGEIDHHFMADPRIPKESFEDYLEKEKHRITAWRTREALIEVDSDEEESHEAFLRAGTVGDRHKSTGVPQDECFAQGCAPRGNKTLPTEAPFRVSTKEHVEIVFIFGEMVDTRKYPWATTRLRDLKDDCADIFGVDADKVTFFTVSESKVRSNKDLEALLCRADTVKFHVVDGVKHQGEDTSRMCNPTCV